MNKSDTVDNLCSNEIFKMQSTLKCTANGKLTLHKFRNRTKIFDGMASEVTEDPNLYLHIHNKRCVLKGQYTKKEKILVQPIIIEENMQ